MSFISLGKGLLLCAPDYNKPPVNEAEKEFREFLKTVKIKGIKKD